MSGFVMALRRPFDVGDLVKVSDHFGKIQKVEVRIWLEKADQISWLSARSEAMIAMKKAFDREGITIPFPIRTLDFGAKVVGGEPLDAMKLRLAQTATER